MSNHPAKPAPPRESDARRAGYQPPQVTWEESIDLGSVAVACGKSDPGNPICLSGGVSS